MIVIETQIPDVKIIHPTLFEDERGYLYESFNHGTFETAIGNKVNFVQDNHSMSYKGVLRGLHHQVAPMAQAKLVRVIQGEIFDVAVDIRETSPTYGQWVGTHLSATNRHQLWIPEGFAHGFYVVSDIAECLYKVTNYYSKEHERVIPWDDSCLNIAWPLTGAPRLSDKDKP
jgi:dTDP-4-dehydrorhamnose 3,5-epimerase